MTTANVTITETPVTVTLQSNGGIPAAHAASHGAAGGDAITIAQSQVTDLTSDLAGKTDNADLPYQVVIPGIVAPVDSTGTITSQYLSNSIFNCYTFTDGVQNRYLEWTVFIAAGTYTLRTAYRASTSYGIASISIDGGAALGTTIDCYAGSATNNNVTDIAGIALTAGRHTIRFTAATKNASSSNYVLGLHGFTLTRTGA
jgi:hypothetical protein